MRDGAKDLIAALEAVLDRQRVELEYERALQRRLIGIIEDQQRLLDDVVRPCSDPRTLRAALAYFGTWPEPVEARPLDSTLH